MGLYTTTILGWNTYLSWFYDRGAVKDPAHTGTSKGLSLAINRGSVRKFLPKYPNVYVTIQSHGLSAGAWTHYVAANGVRNGLCVTMTCIGCFIDYSQCDMPPSTGALERRENQYLFIHLFIFIWGLQSRHSQSSVRSHYNYEFDLIKEVNF